MQQIVGEAGRSFDPQVVEALRHQYQKLEQTANQQAAQGPILSTEVAVENKATPGAGLDMCGLPNGSHAEDFLSTINTAAREQQLLTAMAEAATSLNPVETMQRIETVLRGKIPHDALAFFVPDANVLKAEFAAGKNRAHLLNMEVPVGEGLLGWVAQNLQPVVNGNPAVDPGFYCGTGDPLQSVLSVPLKNSNGLVAVLALYRTNKDAFTRIEFQLVSSIQTNIATALQNAFAFREAETKANLDQLTGLLSRSQFIRLLDEEVSRARRTKEPLALVLSELPDFPELAEAIGTKQAEDLLISIGKGLRHSSREYDRLGRIGENRFALVLPRMKAAHVVAILDRMREITDRSGNAVFGRPVTLKSAGAFYPDDGDAARHLLSVGEQRLEGAHQRWEESLRALIHAGGTSADVTVAPEPEAVPVAERQ
jgi:diguanylate cyclase (GGDEF)-like protein